MTEIPDGWHLSTIGEVAEIVRGVTYSKADTLSANDKDAVPLLRATNLEVDSIDFEDMVYVPKRVVKAQQYLKLNDIFLAASSGSITVVGKSAQVVKTNGETFGAFCAVIRPKEIHPKYLSYWVQSPEIRDHWSATAKGTNINNLKPSDISGTKIPIPPIDEQRKIVERLEDHLSRLDLSLADVKQAKIKASQFRRSLLKSTFEEFGEHSFRLGDVVTFNRRKPTEFKNSKSEVSFVPMPKVSEVSGQIVLDERISHSEGQRRSLTYFEDGDVIFAKITPCMENGKIAHAKNLFGGAAYGSTEFHVLTPTARILPDYLRYFIGSDDFRANAERAMTGAVGQRRVPKTYLEDHAIPLPSLDIQAKIVAQLDESLSRTDEAIKLAEKIETESARLRRALLQSAFTGQLTKEVASV